MAGAADREPRTVLEHLARQQDRTYEELAADFLAVARSLGENATITARHLARLARSERTGPRTHPATRRVLQQMFGRTIEDLLQPWAPTAALDAQSSTVADVPMSFETSAPAPERIALRVDQEGNVWAEVNRRSFIIGSAAALLSQLGAGLDISGTPLAPALEDPYGFAGTLTGAWPGVRTSRPVPDFGVDWQILLPGGRNLIGSGTAVQVHPARRIGDRVLASLDDPRRSAEFLQGPGRRMLVGADTTGDAPHYYLLEAPEAQDAGGGTRRGLGIEVPDAYELDDLTYGILWATANLDDALQANDQTLTEARADLTAYERLSASAVSREAAPGLNPVAHMWLGSDFCARHILRSLPQLPSVPTFWTREQRGEEASPWLLFGHKYAYLRQTARLIGSPIIRAFCIPERAVADSPRYERVLLFLAVALMESLGIHAQITTEPDYGNVEGFVVSPTRQAIIANWVRGDGMWHVDVTNRTGLVRGFTEVAADVNADSVIAAGTAPERLRALAHYLGLEWPWLTSRCAALAGAGTAGMIRPRSRLISSTGLDAACAFVGALPAGS